MKREKSVMREASLHLNPLMAAGGRGKGLAGAGNILAA